MSAAVALTIAGSDPSGGAGVQADLKTFAAHRVYGCAAITALTAQNTRGVTAVHPVPAAVVAGQLETLLTDVTVHATKIGMLPDADVVRAVVSVLRSRPAGPVVLDPVMVATSGDRLAGPDVVTALRDELLPLVDLVTPNVPEAGVLLGERPAEDLAAVIRQAQTLYGRCGVPVLLKGGHLDADHHGGGPGESADVLVDTAGVRIVARDRIDTPATHGTGCTLSSALAALASRRPPGPVPWAPLVEEARSYLQEALRRGAGLGIGHGHGPVGHQVYVAAPD
ncbi:hydroxymethylpyrimidine/phosphomethylpyrimidine kinase [Friedmanniella endophytica]|uniref:Hydroxymethylpyrimidine/phosphomethylpyrimidine kinase n=1 Tax=Microlunatus kandeliicorticis TaxID=1759536 RepID=A0A7W3ITB2_9ACTN|nr:bifunctional hydroxymethylpyrimidine kinase/phosphomethylpyrimidine kinase [Microlunatus kandeliicorticis]MBA8794785.1 hydroxymethylpyrimidine/phosphomethylpyrimidine kinase [Microlunatus kandeliicorticis]